MTLTDPTEELSARIAVALTLAEDLDRITQDMPILNCQVELLGIVIRGIQDEYERRVAQRPDALGV